MERALKVVFAMLVLAAVLPVAFVYGVYFAGARNIRADWGPADAVYPATAREALWRSVGGTDKPSIEPVTPPGFMLRILLQGPGRLDAQSRVLGYVSRVSRPQGESQAAVHMTSFAAAIRASRWPTDRVLDTYLDATYLGGDAHGLRAGSLRVFGQPVEALDDARLHVLVVMMRGPSYFNPWCHPERVRKAVHASARDWHVDASDAQLDAALAAIVPAPADASCRPPVGGA